MQTDGEKVGLDPGFETGMPGPLTVGVDIGGTAVKFGLFASPARLIAESEIETPLDSTPREAVAAITAAVLALAADRPLVAAGVGCAGLVNRSEGILHLSPNLPNWKEIPLAEWFSRDLRCQTAVLNDADAFALAEARVGAGRGRSPVIGITVGTGVGAAIVIDGCLAGGRHGFGGELGHMSLDWQGSPCACGSRGCLELYVGRRPLIASYFAEVSWRPGDPLFDRVNGNREAVTPREIWLAARQGDTVARAVFGRAGEVLGAALANLSNLIDPAVFVIGGGIAQAGDLLLEPARRLLAERALLARERVAPVIAAALGPGAGVLGAALLASDSLASDGEVGCRRQE